LVADEDVGAALRHEVPEAERTAERAVDVEVVVVGLRNGLPVERERRGVERGVAFDDGQLVVEKGPAAAAVVAEGGRLSKRRGRAVVHAAVDHEAVCGLLRVLCRRRLIWKAGATSSRGPLRGSRRRRHTRALTEARAAAAIGC